MQTYIDELVKIERALDDAVLHLREQQDLVADIDTPRSHLALLCLLSNGLRMYCWMEDRQRALAEEIGQFMPLRREV